MSNKDKVHEKFIRQLRIDNHLCIQCGKIVDRDGITCSFCNAQANITKLARKREILAQGLCPDCRKPTDRPGKRCTKCREKATTATNLKRQMKKANGICVYCSEPAVPGITTCEKHRKYKSEIKQRSKEKNNV